MGVRKYFLAGVPIADEGLGDAAFLAQQLDDTVEFHDFWLLKVRYRGTSLFLVYSRLIIHNGKPFVKQEK